MGRHSKTDNHQKFKMTECISTLSRNRSFLAKVSFEELAYNLILAKSGSKEDMNTIMEAGPWPYLGDLVLCEV